MDGTPRSSPGSLLRTSLHFFVFSSIYIALCALMMIHETNHLLRLNYDIFHYLLFVFFSTICSYNFHWGLTPYVETMLVRLSWTNRHKRLHVILCAIGAIGAGWYFFYFIEHWFWVSVSVVLTFLYSAPKVPLLRSLRNIAIGKTLFLAMVWMYVTSALPIFISGKDWGYPELLFCLSRFLFIYSICIIFDYRDRDYDKKEGIKSMITYLDDRGVDLLFRITLILFAICTIALSWSGFGPEVSILILLPGLIILPLYNIARTNFSDYLYYIILDGMMMASPILTTIFI